METKVSPASVEALHLAKAKSIQAKLTELVQLLEATPSIVEKSKIVSSEDEFGVLTTLPNLKSDATQNIGNPLLYLFTTYEDIEVFRDLHLKVLTEYQDGWLCRMLERIQEYFASLWETHNEENVELGYVLY